MSINFMVSNFYMVMGECSAYSSLQAGSEVKFAAWPIRVGDNLVLTDFRSEDPK